MRVVQETAVDICCEGDKAPDGVAVVAAGQDRYKSKPIQVQHAATINLLALDLYQPSAAVAVVELLDFVFDCVDGLAVECVSGLVEGQNWY